MIKLRSPFPPRFDKRIRLIGPVVLFLTGAVFLRLKMYLDTPRNLLLNHFIIALSAGYIGWELTRLTVLYIQTRLPGLERLRKRLFYLAIALFVLANIGYAIRHITQYIVNHNPAGWPTFLGYSTVMGVVIFYTTVTICIYEAGYLWQQAKQTMAEKEKLIRSEWQAKYDLLKSQINPHFLFNSMNSLASLVAEDTTQAEKFIDEMCKVYRYLLRNNEQELVTLDTELQFLHSYCHLLSTRYGSGFQLKLLVSSLYNNFLIPPLTLQLLVENAVKHNVVHKEHPLLVTIQSNEEGLLTISNNVQRKKVAVLSNGMGLANINAKFELLDQKNMTVEEVDELFIVSIPLIKNHDND
ncbi:MULTISPECIES: sensor histidine kinase [Niastella]|uniref:Histidine kinase n=1 Tax=Niastella soli TaxID=2821487 RepID=A0ABS3YW96_9BACT|nr:histidine kinase [Niastella soli]MBO9202143.1 histidine kinase [Niastella soli]